MVEIIHRRLLKWLVCVLLAIVTLAAYAPVAESHFISLDDMDYVLNNAPVRQGLSWSAVKWAFFSFHSSNWHPLTWLSHMLDCQLYGLNPAGHHLTNLAFHIANVLLLFLLLQNLTARLWPSAFVALLFAIHPMHVESVAWVSERKDVLSGFFFLLTLLAYARYVELARAQSRRGWLVYGLALLLFVLGLMAKPMLVTLPCVLCLLDYWPLTRFQLPLKSQSLAVLRRLVVEKIPFFILTALSCWITFIAQVSGDSVRPAADFPLAARLAHIPAAYVWYVLKLFWPTDLSVFYTLHSGHSSGTVAAALFLLLVITLLAVGLARKLPCFPVGWLWFAGMLVPVAGFLQVGNQAYADRYSYLPYIGLFIILAWGLPALLEKWRPHKSVLLAGALIGSTACFKLTVDQVHLWNQGQTLFERAIALDEENQQAWSLLGLQFMSEGKVDKAIDCLRRATTINPRYYQAWHDLGCILSIKGDFAGAQNAFQMALQYTRNKVEIYNCLAALFMTAGRYPEAIANLERSLELSRDEPETHALLGQSLVSIQQPEKAAAEFRTAIRLQPDKADAHMGLAMILGGAGEDAEAIAHYRRVVELETNSVIALNNLAWLLATAADPHLRNGGEAVSLAEHACKLTEYKKAFFIGTLGAAYAEAGRFNDAVAAAQKAHDVALAQGQKEIAANNEHLLELFKSGRACHQEAKAAP